MPEGSQRREGLWQTVLIQWLTIACRNWPVNKWWNSKLPNSFTFSRFRILNLPTWWPPLIGFHIDSNFPSYKKRIVKILLFLIRKVKTHKLWKILNHIELADWFQFCACLIYYPSFNINFKDLVKVYFN